MKYKVICNEKFQTVESVIDVETYEELAVHIRCVRNAILAGYDGPVKKSSSKIKNKAQNLPVERVSEEEGKIIPPEAKIDPSANLGAKNEYSHLGPITDKQKELIKKKAPATIIEQINLDELTNEQASKLIDDLFK